MGILMMSEDKPKTVEDVIEILKARKLEYHHMLMKFSLYNDMTRQEQEYEMSIRGGEIAVNWMLERIGEIDEPI
jgi:predicted transcriptional regulator